MIGEKLKKYAAMDSVIRRSILNLRRGPVAIKDISSKTGIAARIYLIFETFKSKVI